ncbi:hypothetical protein M3P05_14740 [Sansalvadorimonas sp. 2012CJ34-2]|uniref:Uncharacterized protein n=1 Tax=Parendozoicomonas callyspongiae TaxID=2942213 RepID=A0ABT0PJM7_9GAMM|nr:hypothetical protein [Sansalvadorimonas sp. 2012CJ34-2]MCL6271181.1 hypothetical protein [Sansalvadorimonas sp. 2012CJ34-2]
MVQPFDDQAGRKQESKVALIFNTTKKKDKVASDIPLQQGVLTAGYHFTALNNKKNKKGRRN